MDKPWLAHYQEGVPETINPDLHSSLVDLIQSSCHAYPDRIAFENFSHPLSYQSFDEQSQQLASYLQQQGLKKGDRVAIMMPNLLQYPLAIFAILRAGGVVVNTNPLYTSDELIYQLKDADISMLVMLSHFSETVAAALPHLSVKRIIITDLGDSLSCVKRFAVNTVARYIKKLVPKTALPNAIRWRDALAEGRKYTFHAVPLSHEDMAFLQYTGGTTGITKAAVLSHGNMVSNVLQAYTWVSPLNICPYDVVVTALPLYHIFALTANCLTFIKAGAKNVLITNPRDIKSVIRNIKRIGFTAFTGVNTLFNAMLNHPGFKKIDFSQVKLTLSGGMSLQKSVSQRWLEESNTPILEAYGLTETSPAVTINPMYLRQYNGSIGLPLPSTIVSIRNEEGHPLPLGEAGELCIQGPQVMRAYWQRPEETANVFTKDGFLKTGDIARMDANGFVYLVDRKKDLIIVSGFNVYPNEVEQVIGQHPDVLEVGVIGVHDNTGNERVKAFVVKRNESLTEEELIAFCRQHLTPYKVPKFIEFRTSLPKTNVGKILRRALK